MRKSLSVILVFLLIFALAGCTAKENPSETSSATSVSNGMFKKGLWEVVKDNTRIGYYYFSEDGTECKYKDVALLSGIPFDYEISGNGYVFHMASADDNTSVSLKDGQTDATELTLIFADREEHIRYIRDCTIEEYTAQP